jgi:DNA-binding NarL/FixJ family response regulator
MNKSSILIVDDEESIRISLKGFLSKKYYTQTAASASIALEILHNDHYDLILTDIMMDNMNGIELLKNIKKSFPAIQVLLMTGYSSLDTAIEAIRQGASDYLVKPCSKNEILLSIARCLENNSTERHERLTEHFQSNINILPGKRPLTKRELEIFNHLISGMSDKSMAEELAVTIATIKFHLQNIYKKSGVNGRKGVLKIIADYKGRKVEA